MGTKTPNPTTPRIVEGVGVSVTIGGAKAPATIDMEGGEYQQALLRIQTAAASPGKMWSEPWLILNELLTLSKLPLSQLAELAAYLPAPPKKGGRPRGHTDEIRDQLTMARKFNADGNTIHEAVERTMICYPPTGKVPSRAKTLRAMLRRQNPA